MRGPDIPVVDFAGISTYPAGSSFGPHVTTGHELVWIEEGTAQVSSGDLVVALRPGSVLVTPRGSRAHYVWDPRTTTRHGYVVFQGGDVEQQAVDLPAGDVVPALLRHVVHLQGTRPDGWRADADDALRVALRALVVPRASTERLLSPVVLASLEAVRRRWPSQGPWPAVPLPELAAAAGVTQEYLCRAWVKDVDISPVAALRSIRLFRASFLLLRSNIAIGDVSRMAGFDSPFHFSRAFKTHFGASPTAFREQRTPPTEVPAGLRAVMSRL